MKIHSFSIENTKRVRAVELKPAQDGLTILGGNNGQGKTSVLDAIAWALGGDKRRPSNAHRDDSVLPPSIRIVLDNGIIVERKGKNSALTVTDPAGRKAGQQLLNAFISELAIDLPKFMEASDKEKAKVLLEIIGVNDKLSKLDAEETDLYNQRRALGRIVDQKAAFVKSLPYYPDAPKDLIDPVEMIREVQEILAVNRENERKRQAMDRLTHERFIAASALEAAQKRYDEACAALAIAEDACRDLVDGDTAELEAAIANAEEINRRVRANMDKDKAEEDGKEETHRYNCMTARIDEIRRERQALLESAQLPLPGLGVEDGCLTYEGKKWDCMSGSQQLKVATAIAGAFKPECGFVLLDKLEQMDVPTLREFGAWLEEQGLQAIATRVSTGEECTIIIEDGVVAETTKEEKTWKKGGFAHANHQR